MIAKQYLNDFNAFIDLMKLFDPNWLEKFVSISLDFVGRFNDSTSLFLRFFGID